MNDRKLTFHCRELVLPLTQMAAIILSVEIFSKKKDQTIVKLYTHYKNLLLVI